MGRVSGGSLCVSRQTARVARLSEVTDVKDATLFLKCEVKERGGILLQRAHPPQSGPLYHETPGPKERE